MQFQLKRKRRQQSKNLIKNGKSNNYKLLIGIAAAVDSRGDGTCTGWTTCLSLNVEVALAAFVVIIEFLHARGPVTTGQKTGTHLNRNKDGGLHA